MFWAEADKTHASISQFSAKDADAFFEYEDFLGKVREIIQPLLDNSPPEVDKNVIHIKDELDDSPSDFIIFLKNLREVPFSNLKLSGYFYR